MVQVTLEEYKIRLAEVQEQIGRLRVEVPEGVPGAPERVLLIDPGTIPFVFLGQ